jgi:hypothetical protein
MVNVTQIDADVTIRASGCDQDSNLLGTIDNRLENLPEGDRVNHSMLGD